MNAVKLSILLTFVSLLVLVVLIFPLGYFFVKTLDFNVAFAVFSFAISFHVVNYFVVQKFLQFKEKKYLISLKNKKNYAPFRGGDYLKFYLGFVWRTALLNILITPVLENIAPDAGGLFSIVSGSMITCFSYLWLIKYCYGDVRIVFNIEDQGYVVSEGGQDIEKVDFSERKATSFSSGLGDFIAGSMGSLFFGGYFLLGILQYAAIYSFFRDVLDWWFLPSAIFSLFAAYAPVVGTGLGIYSAHEAWDWSWLGSILLFTWPFALFLVFMVGASIWNFVETSFVKRKA